MAHNSPGGSGVALVWGIAGLVCGLTCVLACRAALFATPVAPAWLCGALVACTIVAGATTCANTTSTVTVNAGDSVQIEFVKNGTCSGYITWGVAGTYTL